MEEGQTDGESIALKKLNLFATFSYARSPGMQNSPDSSQKYHCFTAKLKLLHQRFADKCFQKQECGIWC